MTTALQRGTLQFLTTDPTKRPVQTGRFSFRRYHTDV